MCILGLAYPVFYNIMSIVYFILIPTIKPFNYVDFFFELRDRISRFGSRFPTLDTFTYAYYEIHCSPNRIALPQIWTIIYTCSLVLMKLHDYNFFSFSVKLILDFTFQLKYNFLPFLPVKRILKELFRN